MWNIINVDTLAVGLYGAGRLQDVLCYIVGSGVSAGGGWNGVEEEEWREAPDLLARQASARRHTISQGSSSQTLHVLCVKNQQEGARRARGGEMRCTGRRSRAPALMAFV